MNGSGFAKATSSRKRLPQACLALALVALATSARPAAAPTDAALGLTLGPNGTVLHAGRTFVGVGVNFYSCFTRTLARADDTSYDAGFATLARYGIPFARFSASGFWPREMSLYVTNRAEYFRRFDGVVRSAERHGIGLIPSLFWQRSCVPDLVSEPGGEWGNPRSKTHAFLREYVREVVTRYRNSPAIWAWEFGNEFNLAADLPNAAEHRPPVIRDRGTPSIRTAADDLTYAALRAAWTAFGEEVRRLDSHRLITSGNSIPRTAAWHNRHEQSWRTDSPGQFAEILALDTPDPLNLISVHCYDDALARLNEVVRAAKEIGKPVFVGEFQIADAHEESGRAAFETFLRQLREAGVPLAAAWAFDRPEDEKLNIAEGHVRGWQLALLQAWNQKVAAGH